MTTSPLHVDVFSDIVCPWCYIGRKRLQDTLASTDGAKDALVTHRTYLLDPTLPKEGVDLRENLTRKYGNAERMFPMVEGAAREAGISLDFTKIRRMPSTVDAHTLLRHALAKGTQPAFVNALFESYFLNGEDIGDTTLLVAHATKHGFTSDEAESLLRDEVERATTRKDAVVASRSGIQGVPFFVFNEELAFSGAQPEAIFRQVLERVLTKS